MSKGKRYKTPAKYWHKRVNKRGWDGTHFNYRIGGKNKRATNPRRTKFFKNLGEVFHLSMKKLWEMKYRWYYYY